MMFRTIIRSNIVPRFVGTNNFSKRLISQNKISIKNDFSKPQQTRTHKRFSTASPQQQPTPAEQAGQETTALTTITFKEGAKAGFNVMILAGVVGAVGVCGYLISKELFPSKMSPNSVFNQAFEHVRNHAEVTARLGTPV
jgi:hypothetical protein